MVGLNNTAKVVVLCLLIHSCLSSCTGNCGVEGGGPQNGDENFLLQNSIWPEVGADDPSNSAAALELKDEGLPSLTDLRHRHHVASLLSIMLGLGKDTPNTDAVIGRLEDALKEAGHEIAEGHTEHEGLAKKQTDQYDQWASDVAIKTICETGFNAGHSAARFLSNGNANVYEFDLGSHDYSHTAEGFLKSKYSDRLKVTWGDSRMTLPQFRTNNPDVHCDLVVVDGGHDFEVAYQDLENFAPMASSNHFLAIDDTPCEEWWCTGPTQAWKNLTQQGCIKESGQVSIDYGRGFTIGKYTPCPLWPNLGK